MKPVTQDYQSYLLRLWKSGLEGEASWRASLESPSTGMRQGFVSLQDLVAFLAEVCDEELLLLAADQLAGDQSAGQGVYPQRRR